MKKVKTQPATKSPKGASADNFPWWPLSAAVVGFVLVWIVYGPALRGPFVFDDRFLPVRDADAAVRPFLSWVLGNRPFLMFTFWLNFQAGGIETTGYHTVNVLLHFGTSVAIGLCVAKLLELAGVRSTKKLALSVFGGALFLLHPVQTESVAYIVSRSETLSVLFFFSAFAVFLWRPPGTVSWGRIAVLGVLMAAALSTKEHTLTLPFLLLLTDFYFNPRGVRENLRMYALFAVIGIAGAVGVTAVLRTSNSAGFSLENLTPASYAFTQWRVIWMYVRMFFLPYGLNLDPDIPVSQSPLEHGAVFGLLALLAAVAAAWIYRKQWPLASYGFFVFLLLLAPTSSFIPILDVLAEHRLYLPFIGLTLVTVDVLRRLQSSHATWIAIGALAVCSVLTFQRATLWGDPVLLWSDSAAKSPRKMRPNFQLAYALYEKQRCAESLKYFEIAAGIQKPRLNLLTDWALAYDCLGRLDNALEKLRQADALGPDAPTKALMAVFLGRQQKWDQALAMLAEAEKVDPKYPDTYLYRGDLYEVEGNLEAAAAEYRRALAVAPWFDKARENLARVTRR